MNKSSYGKILKNNHYMRKVLSNIISRFGDSIDAIAFTYLVYAVTGSASWSAIIFGLNQIPTILIQPFAGALVENLNKKKVMVITDFIRGGIVLVLAFLCVKGMVTAEILVIFTLIISTAEAFSLPAGMAFVPMILPIDDYEFGTSLNNTICRVMELIGIGASGIIIGIWGIGGAIIIDAVTFIVSALITLTIKNPEKIEKENVKLSVKGYFETLKEGITYIKQKKIVLNFCIVAFFINAVLVPLNALQTPLVVEVLGKGSEFLSIIGVSQVIAMALAAFLYPYIAKRVNANKIVSIGGIIMGSSYFFLISHKWILLTCILGSFLLGFGASQIMSTLSVQFVKQVEQKYLSRAGAIFNAGATFASPITSVFISVIALCVPVKTILFFSGVFCVIVFTMILVLKVKLE